MCAGIHEYPSPGPLLRLAEIVRRKKKPTERKDFVQMRAPDKSLVDHLSRLLHDRVKDMIVADHQGQPAPLGRGNNLICFF
jgi:hypothetical protein